MKCSDFAKNLENQEKRDRKKSNDTSLRAQALSRATDSSYQPRIIDPWDWVLENNKAKSE